MHGPAHGRDAPAHADAGVVYRSCQQVRQNFPTAPNGIYLLHNGAKLFTVYCADMATAPKEYVTLEKTGQSENYSQYTAAARPPARTSGPASPGSASTPRRSSLTSAT
ncbi:GON domain-containing protein [Actinomadura luteofluorescens]|uniref:GON domain-containing protein n=1 Tax=Actinomadura luteofluorescens TaxID=46163 RepID=UPI00363A8850